jgi:hypothetical protein
MISLVELLNEIKASKYVDIIENLLLKINWNQFQEFQSIQDNALSIIDDIKNIHNYEGKSAVEYLKEIKKQADDIIYILNNLLENQIDEE